MNFIVSHNLILPKYLIIVKEKGSKISKTRAREGGASVFTALLSSFCISAPPFACSKKFGAKSKQAGKKEGGWGEGIFARLPKRSPAALLAKSRTQQKSFLFLLEEKNRRAQIKKCEENFFAGWRGFRATAGLASLLGVLLKKCSNFVQETPPIYTFCEIVRNSLGAKRLGMVFFRNFEGIFEIARQRAVGNAEVPVRKHRENEVFRTNLFSFAFSERLSVFFFDCPKTNFKTIWTT